MKRRDFIIAAASTPILTQLKAFAKEDSELQGFVVMVIDARNLHPQKVEDHIEKMKERFKRGQKRPEGWSIIFFPTRDYESNIEIYKVHPHAQVEQIENYLCLEDNPNYDLYLAECEDHDDTHILLEESQFEVASLKLDLAEQKAQANRNITALLEQLVLDTQGHVISSKFKLEDYLV